MLQVGLEACTGVHYACTGLHCGRTRVTLMAEACHNFSNVRLSATLGSGVQLCVTVQQESP